jgi:UDP-N-acetylmuramate dehydrogenase
MHKHTTFGVGGPADLYAVPSDAEDVAELLRFAREYEIPLFTLGGGSNILVSDQGIRGMVMDTRGFDRLEQQGTTVIAGSGLEISTASAFAADRGLEGLHFLYSMPGSVGGAVWMNARCYGHSVIDVLADVFCVTPEGGILHYTPRFEDFAYKVSPFQSNGWVILEASFALREGDRSALWDAMHGYEADRREKGHFAAPSAGSVFKNDRSLGRPSGAIIDSLGLRGSQIGGARISDQHANIIINTGDATATDIRHLIELIEQRVETELGLQLEREVLLAGDWEDADADVTR